MKFSSFKVSGAGLVFGIFCGIVRQKMSSKIGIALFNGSISQARKWLNLNNRRLCIIGHLKFRLFPERKSISLYSEGVVEVRILPKV
jgi:hypothetical protein